MPPAPQPGALRRAQEVVAAGPSSAANHTGGSEAELKLPDLSSVKFLGVNGRVLLMVGLVVCAAGLLFGLVDLRPAQEPPVHSSMREISELIYETCKTYLVTQGKFILILWVFIAVVILLYFGLLLNVRHAAAG